MFSHGVSFHDSCWILGLVWANAIDVNSKQYHLSALYLSVSLLKY